MSETAGQRFIVLGNQEPWAYCRMISVVIPPKFRAAAFLKRLHIQHWMPYFEYGRPYGEGYFYNRSSDCGVPAGVGGGVGRTEIGSVSESRSAS